MPGMHLRLLLLWIAFILISGCSQDAATLVESAKSRRAKGDRVGAILQLKNAIQADPKNAATRHFLAQLYLEARDGISAEKELRAAAELGKKDQGELKADLAQALWIQGNAAALLKEIALPEGQELGRDALIKIHVFRGRAQAQLGQVAASRESLNQARAAAGAKPMPALALLEAHILSREDKTADAVAILDAVLKDQPRLYDALLLRADLLRESRKIEETIVALNELLAAYPKDLNGLIARSSMLVLKAQFDSAEKDIQILRQEHTQHFMTSFQDGLLRFRKGQFRLAVEAFQATLKRNRNFDEARFYLGMAHLALGEALQAERALSLFLNSHPENAAARLSLAAALIDTNEPARALDIIVPGLAIAPTPALVNLAAEAYFRLGELDKAADLFGKAAAKAGEGSPADEKRAITRLYAGDQEGALADFERIAKARKGASNVDIALVLGHLRKNPDRALALIDELDKKFPKQPFNYNLKGMALLQKGQKEAAISAFNEALKIQPAFFPAAANLFKLDVESGNLEQGRGRFEAVLKADRNHYQALLALAELQQISGKPKEAMELLKRAATAHPQQAEPWTRLIDIHMRRGDFEESMQVAQDFLNRNSSSFIAAELMGKVQLAQGDANSAVATYSRLTTDHPRSERAHLLLAEAQLKANRVSDAERNLRRVLELNPDYRQGQLAWVGLMVKGKRVDEAKRFAQMLQKDRPKSAAGWALEADIHWAQSKFADAAKALSNALTVAPRDDFAIRRYEAQSRADDAKNALMAFRQFVEQHPGALAAHVHLAEILLRSGDYAGAVKYYEPATKAPNLNPMVLNNLALAYYKLNDPRALRVGEQAHRAVPDNAVIQDTLGMILLRDGDPKRALELFERAVKKQPNHPEMRFHLAQALHKTGDKERAKSELTQLLQKHNSFPEREQAVALLKAIGA